MTEKRQNLQNQLKQNAGNQVANKEKTPEQKVGAYLQNNMKAIKSVLPKHLDEDRLARIAFNVIRTNPLLLQCSMPSLMGGVMEAAKLGLEPGMMGQAYIIPFKNYKASKAQGQDVYEAQFIIGYRGLIDLVRRSGQVSTISAQAVHENDEFHFEYGLEDKLEHKPKLKERGAPIAYYAIAKMKDGGYNFLVMSKEDIEQYRDKHSKSQKNGTHYGPWAEEFDAMAKKTVLRQLIKYLPISIEFLSNDEQNGAQTHNEIAAEENVLDIDSETGEILNHGE